MDVKATRTSVRPRRVAATVAVRWAISTRIASCRWGHRPPTTQRPHHHLWFAAAATGSWALARYDREPGPYLIRQHGPRRLWDEIEAAYHWWRAAGEPAAGSWRFTVTPEGTPTTLRRLSERCAPTGAARRS